MSSPLIKIARDGKTIGEYTLAELGQALRAKTILPTDHYWREGMKAWERVHFIAAEAEAAIPKAAPSPPPLVSKPSTEGSGKSEEVSAAGRLYYVLGALAIPVAAIVAIMDVSDVREKMSVFQGLGASNPHKLKLADAIEDVCAQQLETLTWFLVFWAIARLAYYVLKGKVTPNDAPKMKLGANFFGVALICFIISISYSLSTTGRALVFAHHSDQARQR